jgi:N-acetylmuramoyl-L-alanine amidase
MIPDKTRWLSYVERLEYRHFDSIRTVVIHCTELPDLQTARFWGEKLCHEESSTGNSGHFYIDRNGYTEQWVPLDRVAHHVRGHNASSIGIELVNTGRYPHWFRSDHQQMNESYPDAQVEALLAVLKYLENKLPRLASITGHEELDREMLPSEDQPDVRIHRKVDPGPLFPWPLVMENTSLERLKVPG